MKDSVKQDNAKMLFKAVLTLQNEEECAGFFKDLCTDTEIYSMAQRFVVAKMVAEGKKYDEITQAERDELSAVEKKIVDEKSKKDAVLSKYAGGNKVIRQLVDLALLQNNMLKGEALTNFVKRSIDMIG